MIAVTPVDKPDGWKQFITAETLEFARFEREDGRRVLIFCVAGYLLSIQRNKIKYGKAYKRYLKLLKHSHLLQTGKAPARC